MVSAQSYDRRWTNINFITNAPDRKSLRDLQQGPRAMDCNIFHQLVKVMKIREATKKDFDQIWPIFHEIVRAGETYAYPQNTSKEQALKIWMDTPKKTFVSEDDGNILGTYYNPAKGYVEALVMYKWIY